MRHKTNEAFAEFQQKMNMTWMKNARICFLAVSAYRQRKHFLQIYLQFPVACSLALKL